ncbi:hypothetical protein AKJ60_00145 [candidate division MSBL1 archaeon SCGC-AAA385M11]|nr:hypothetical protein AKJ60_00145 [candidate division MSBL1 archaeon SCGC-AAA385M11]
MNDESNSNNTQKDELIKYWTEKADESLQSARSEYQNERLSFAMNRIYYSAFYALTALFKSNDKVFRKHKELRSALHRELIRQGTLDKSWGKFFDEVFESRQRGDYMPMVRFENEQVEYLLEQADIFLTEIKKLLSK